MRGEPAADVLVRKAEDILRRAAVGGVVGHVGFEAQIFPAAEQVAVLPVALQRRTVDCGILRLDAERMGRPVADVDRKRQPALGVEMVGLLDAHRADRRDLPQVLFGVAERGGRIGVAGLQIEE